MTLPRVGKGRREAMWERAKVGRIEHVPAVLNAWWMKWAMLSLSLIVRPRSRSRSRSADQSPGRSRTRRTEVAISGGISSGRAGSLLARIVVRIRARWLRVRILL